MIKYDNVKSDELNEVLEGKKHFIQKFNSQWFKVVVFDEIYNVMLNASTQILDKNSILEKEILHYFGFIDKKDFKVDVYFDIDYRTENTVLSIPELDQAIKTELENKTLEKQQEKKKMERKEQIKYFAIKRAMEKKEKQREQQIYR